MRAKHTTTSPAAPTRSAMRSASRYPVSAYEVGTTRRCVYIAVSLFLLSAGNAFAQAPQTNDVGFWLATTPGGAELLTLPSQPPVEAAETPRLAASWQTLGDQLVRLLGVPDAEVQERALQHLLYFTTRHSGDLGLTGAAEPLLAIYQQADQERHRVLAAAILYTLDVEHARTALERGADAETTDRVAQVAALHDRYHR